MAEKEKPEKPEKLKKGETISILKCLKVEGGACRLMSCVCCGRSINQRMIMTLLTVFGIIACYTQRVCLSLAITEMTIPKSANATKSGPGSCPTNSKSDRPVIDPIQGGKFDWDERVQGYLLMAFFCGYLFGNVPAGLLCDKFGAKWIIFTGVLTSSVATALVPLAAIYMHWSLVFILRALTGLGQSPIYPGATYLICRWVPSTERGLVGGIVLSSLSLGTVLGNIPTAYILENLKTWVWVFYFYGILGALFCFLFAILVYSSPEQHPFITPEEKEYLAARIKPATKHKVPVKSIFGDIVVWACLINQFGNDYTLFTIITNFPKYLRDVLKFTSKESGLLVCIPQVSMFVFSFIFGLVSDALAAHCGIPVAYIRIINTCIATCVPCICLFACVLFRCQRWWAVAMISIGMASKGAFYCGMKVTLIDITQNNTGVVSAIVNACGAISGAIAPYTIGQIAVDNTFPQWDLISIVTIIIGIVSAIPYALFCRAERRLWDYEDDDPDKPKEKWPVMSCRNAH